MSDPVDDFPPVDDSPPPPDDSPPPENTNPPPTGPPPVYDPVNYPVAGSVGREVPGAVIPPAPPVPTPPVGAPVEYPDSPPLDVGSDAIDPGPAAFHGEGVNVAEKFRINPDKPILNGAADQSVSTIESEMVRRPSEEELRRQQLRDRIENYFEDAGRLQFRFGSGDVWIRIVYCNRCGAMVIRTAELLLMHVNHHLKVG